MRNPILALALLALDILAVGGLIFVYTLPSEQPKQPQANTTLLAQPSVTQTGGTMPKGVEFGSIDRERYNLSSKIFEDLPKPPENFYAYIASMESRTLRDVCILGEDVYNQPEFYPNFDKSPINASDFGAGIRMFKEHDYSRWGTVGFGAHPSDAYVLAQGGAEFDSCTFFHTSWDIQWWQGFKFYPSYPNASFDQWGNLIVVQNDSVKDYITATVTPNQVLLSPTFPKFLANWTYRVQFHVKVAENTPKGVYVVALGLGLPDEKQDQLWAIQHIGKYGATGEQHGVGRPMYRVIIEVK